MFVAVFNPNANSKKEINLPAYIVEYVNGYLGCGVNSHAHEYFRTEAEALARAEELRTKTIGVKTYKKENFYHTLP